MLRRFMTCTLGLSLLAAASGSMADNVEMSPAERAAKVKAYEARKAQGLTPDAPRGRGADKQRAQKQAQQQAQERAQRCQDAINDAQKTAVGASVLTSAVGFLPFAGAASGIANAAAGVGASAAGEIARQKAAAAVQGNC